MFVNLSSASLFSSCSIEFIKQDRLKVVVSYIALGILCVGAIYWIFSHFWQNRPVKRGGAPRLASLFESTKPLPAKDRELVRRAPLDMQKERGSELSAKKETLKKDSSVSDSKQDLEHSSQRDMKNDEGNVRREVDEYLNSFFSDGRVFPLASDERSFSKSAQPDKKEFYYEDMAMSLEVVKKALKECDNKGEQQWVRFCNSAFVTYHLLTGDLAYNWELHVSIDPAQRDKVWEIVYEELECSSLPIFGKIHSGTSVDTTQCRPGMEITLCVLKASEERRREWLQFLSSLNYSLLERGIHPDSRLVNSDFQDSPRPWCASIPCPGKPAIFSYSNNNYQVIDDKSWDEIDAKSSPQIKDVEEQLEINTLIKASYYEKMSESERLNPLKTKDPFEGFSLSY